jgi:hypothetical protein
MPPPAKYEKLRENEDSEELLYDEFQQMALSRGSKITPVSFKIALFLSILCNALFLSQLVYHRGKLEVCDKAPLTEYGTLSTASSD